MYIDMETEKMIASFLYMAVEFCKYSIFIICVMGGKRSKFLFTVAAGILFVINTSILEWHFSDTNTVTMLMYVFLLIFPVFALRGSFRYRLYITMVSFSFISVLNTIFQIIVANLSSVIVYNSGRIISVIWFEFCTIWLFLLFSYALYRLIGPKEPVPAQPPLYFLAIAILDVCCSIYIIYVLTSISRFFLDTGSRLREQDIKYMICSICFLSLGMIFLAASLFFHVLYNARNHYRKLLDTRERYITLQTQYYDQQLRSYQEMRSFRHDLKNHLAVIRQLHQNGKSQELTEYIQKLDQSLQKNSLYCDCGHSIASALVSYTALRASSLGISFHCAGHLPEHLHIDPLDLCTVLGNILDNALESCSRVLENGGISGNAFMDIQFLYKNSHTIIVLRNSALQQNMTENAPLSTLKKEAEHGIGMQNVIQVLQKYDASISWKAEDYVFYTEIIL